MELSVRITQEQASTYVAVSPTVPKCTGRGRTAKEALENYQREVRRYIRISGDTFPDCLRFRVMKRDEPVCA